MYIWPTDCPVALVAFSLKNASKESGSSDYTARDTATGTSTVVVNSYTGLLHKRTLKIDAGSAIDGQHAERIYLVLKLVGQSEQPVLSTPDLLERGLMEFVHTHTLLALPADGVLALVVPTYAGPLELQSSRKGNHSVQKGM